MLVSLDIRDILIIDRLELRFRPGLNALTGETGAGKSILLDALGFVLGWRGRADIVRGGADQGEVIAVFELARSHSAFDVLADAGLPQDETLILRRVNSRDGRKTAWVNDRRVSGEVLRRLSETLVELHGQNDDRGLLDASGHRALLDAFGGYEDLRQAVRKAWNEKKSADEALAQAELRVAALREEEEFLRHSVAELGKLSPEPGEDAALDAERRRMQAASRVKEDVARAHAALGLEGADGLLRDATRWIEGAAEGLGDDLEALLSAMERAAAELAEAEDGVARLLERLDFDPLRLEGVEERLFAIRALARKHGVAPDDLGEFALKLGERLAALEGGEDDLKRLRTRRKAAGDDYRTAAAQLTQARRDAGSRLSRAMKRELAPLKMERATFEVSVEAADEGPQGVDRIEFRVTTNPGVPAGALNKIASGGELSRFLLALKVCLSDRDAGRTMIFDEIDRGVGGATADAVGRRLETLAQTGQVLVVTHSPQVAARASHQWRVSKRVVDGQTLSDVVALDPDARVDEIARMLSGEALTDAARAAANALLSD
jgi:DNA repair protein RecN (Recombination protein N)